MPEDQVNLNTRGKASRELQVDAFIGTLHNDDQSYCRRRSRLFESESIFEKLSDGRSELFNEIGRRCAFHLVEERYVWREYREINAIIEMRLKSEATKNVTEFTND